MTFQLRNDSAQSSSVQIEQYYAREILTGRLAPGTKLPSNAELAAIWKTSARAIHSALGGLVVQGLIERKQRRGTFVRDLFQNSLIGILVGGNLIRDTATFTRALCAEIQTQLEEYHFSCRVYDDLWRESQAEEDQTPSLRHFLLDRKVYDFKGFVYIGTATIGSIPVIDDLRPRVVHLDSTRGLDIVLDMGDFLTTTISEMTRRGHSNICYVRALWSSKLGQKATPIATALAEAAVANSIPNPELWDLWLECDATEIEERAYAIILAELKKKKWGAGGKTPDAIIVTDDVIARPLVFAMKDMGLRVPEDIKICTQASAGVEFFYGTPVYKYQFSTKALAKHLISLLQNRMIRLEDPPLPILLKGDFIDPFVRKER